MSLPREVLPGRTYMITRRCTQRQFLMRPDDATNNAFIYCLALAAQRAGVLVIFTAAQSNHHHTGIFDPCGTYPDFIEHFHKLFAKSMNCLRGRWENFWSSEQTNVLRLVEPSDVLDKMTYALTNPVKDNLVAKTLDWPGVNSFQTTISGRTLTAFRPAHFFRADGPMPETVTLTICQPHEFADLSPSEFRALIAAPVLAAEEAATAERQRKGTRLLGRRAILNQHWRARPDSHEPRRQLDPGVAAKNKWKRIEALVRNKTFQQCYAAAFAALKAGVKATIFPAGTYWLRRFAAVVCEPWPTPAPAG